MSAAILAIDLGGTRYRAGRASTDAPANVEPLAEAAAPVDRDDFLALLGRQLAAIGATRLGIGVPGLATGTTCDWVPNLGWLDGLDLAAAFPGVGVGLGNDAQLGLLAEARAGAAQGLSDALLLAIGTGIGSAVLAGGRIVAGHHGGACSFGWAAADLADPGEDRSGWLERHASGRALDAAARRIGLADGFALVAAARTGDEAAIAALTPPMTALGTALAGAVALSTRGDHPRRRRRRARRARPLIRPALDRHLPPHLRGIACVPAASGRAPGSSAPPSPGRPARLREQRD